MKKVLFSRIKNVIVLFTGMCLLAALTSCENFLRGAETKDQLDRIIAYNNAKSYTIKVEAEKGSGVIRIPADGQVEKKVTDKFTVKFEPDEGYRFTQWTAIIPNLAEGESAGDYIQFEDAKELETQVTFVKAHESIVIVPDSPAIPSEVVLLDGSHGRFSPLTGEHLFRQEHPVSISYEPYSDYEFVRWKIYDSNSSTKQEIENGRYLTITDTTAERTECVLTTPLEEGSSIKLCIEPVNIKRPRVTSESPKWTETGVYSDTRIQVMFDQPMSTSSIYYSTDEITNLKVKYELEDDDFIKDGDDWYGYTYQGQDYYKNIQVMDYTYNVSLLDKFNKPYFETPNTLVIPVIQSKAPARGTTVVVTIEDGFCIEVETAPKKTKPVTLKEMAMWEYIVDGQIDDTPPDFVTIDIKNTRETNESLGTDSDHSVKLIDRKLKMDLKVNDPGTGPAPYFLLNIKKVGQQNWMEPKPVVPATVYLKDAVYNGTYTLPALEDGFYELQVLSTDNSGRQGPCENTYYFQIDTKAPVISNITCVPQTDSIKVIFTADDFNYNDLDYLSVIHLRRNFYPYYVRTTTVNKNNITSESENSYSFVLSDSISGGDVRDITIIAYDDLNHKATYRTAGSSLVKPVSDISNQEIVETNGELYWRCHLNQPEGYCDGTIIKVYRKAPQTNSSFVDSGDVEYYQKIDNCSVKLPGPGQYKFKITNYFKNENNQIVMSDAFETTPVMTPAPELTDNDVKIVVIPSAKPSIQIKIEKMGSIITGVWVYYKQHSDTNYTQYINNGNPKITGPTVILVNVEKTQYDIKIIPYLIEETNIGPEFVKTVEVTGVAPF